MSEKQELRRRVEKFARQLHDEGHEMPDILSALLTVVTTATAYNYGPAVLRYQAKQLAGIADRYEAEHIEAQGSA